MNSKQLNTNLQFWPYHFKIVQQYDLTLREGVLLAYLYNHCVNINKFGYCGYSTERIAKENNTKINTIEKSLKKLKDKGLIIIDNPGKRTKKTGESRMIFINAENYIHPSQDICKEDQIQKLKQENELLKQQKLALEQKISNTHIPQASFLGIKLMKTGFMSSDEYMRECNFYNTILQKFLEDTDFEWVQKSFNYFANKRATTIDCYPSYLTSCIKSSILHYQYINLL